MIDIPLLVNLPDSALDHELVTDNMTYNATLANAIALLVTVVNSIPRAKSPPHRVFDPFSSTDPFNLSSCSGLSAYVTVFASIGHIWDRDTSTFPFFVVSLRIRAKEGKWDSSSTTNANSNIISNPTNIIDMTENNILIEYHSITDAEVSVASTTRTDNREIQNAKVVFMYIKSSIKGDIRLAIFTQFNNLLSHDNGNSLF